MPIPKNSWLKPTCVVLPQDLKKNLKRVAAREHTNVSRILNLCAEEYLKKICGATEMNTTSMFFRIPTPILDSMKIISVEKDILLMDALKEACLIYLDRNKHLLEKEIVIFDK